MRFLIQLMMVAAFAAGWGRSYQTGADSYYLAGSGVAVVLAVWLYCTRHPKR